MWLKNMRLEVYRRWYSLLPIKRNKIIFWSFGFNSYNCNPKYIALELEKQYRGEFDIVWVFDDSVDIPMDFPHRFVRFFSLDYMKEIATAKMIVCNSRIDEKRFYFRKRSEQIYLQTWHGSYGPKCIEADAAVQLGDGYVSMAKRDSEICDMMLASCDKFADLCRASCWYNGKVMVSGMPRCDIFFDPDENRKSSIREKLGLPRNEKLVLYAPTFRDGLADWQGPDFVRLCTALGEKFGGTWTAVRSIHPNLRHRKLHETPGLIILPENTDVQELIHICDCLVTDYSSTMIDAAIARKPVFLFTPDLVSYRSDDRGFYYDIEDTPFPLCEDDEALVRAVARYSAKDYIQAAQRYLKWMGSKEDGHCAERVVRWIHGRMEAL